MESEISRLIKYMLTSALIFNIPNIPFINLFFWGPITFELGGLGSPQNFYYWPALLIGKQVDLFGITQAIVTGIAWSIIGGFVGFIIYKMKHRTVKMSHS